MEFAVLKIIFHTKKKANVNKQPELVRGGVIRILSVREITNAVAPSVAANYVCHLIEPEPLMILVRENDLKQFLLLANI